MGVDLIKILSDDSKKAILWLEKKCNVHFDEVKMLGGHQEARTHRSSKCVAAGADKRLSVGWLIFRKIGFVVAFCETPGNVNAYLIRHLHS